MKLKNIASTIIAAALVLGLIGLIVWFGHHRPGASTAFAKPSTPEAAKAKILFINSYHAGYPWSDAEEDGFLATLNVHRLKGGELDCSASRVMVRMFDMDTKRHGSEEFKRQAGAQAKALIESWKPDVVVGCDDNYAKYVIVPYFYNSQLPFIFCGVNWDASEYALPCRNVTGMLEVAYIPTLMDALRPYARGSRVGLLGARNETNDKEARFYVKSAGVKIAEEVLVDTFEQWKAAYLDLQGKVDMLILLPPSFIQSSPSDEAEARRFVLENTRIPSGSVEDWIAPYSLICQAKVGSEQGEWVAKAALRILAGTSPKDIPVASNYRTQVVLNMPLAKKLQVRFPISLIEQATLLNEE